MPQPISSIAPTVDIVAQPRNRWPISFAAYAVVDKAGSCIWSGRVNALAISSYTAELFAILAAFFRTSSRLFIYTDCKIVANLFNRMCHAKQTCEDWQHSKWWQMLFDTWIARESIMPDVLRLVWVPAHTCNHVDIDNITDDLVRHSGFSAKCIINNRIADQHAKQLAFSFLPVDPQYFVQLQKDAFSRQFLLADLNRVIGNNVEAQMVQAPKEDNLPPDAGLDLVARFPEWDWQPQQSLFSWVPRNTPNVLFLLVKKFPQDDANNLVNFLSSLK